MSDKKMRDEIFPRFELVEMCFLKRVARTMTEGSVKYGDYNWRGFSEELKKDIPRHAFVHIQKYMNGDKSEDHLAHAACNIMMSMYFEEHDSKIQPPLPETTQAGELVDIGMSFSFSVERKDESVTINPYVPAGVEADTKEIADRLYEGMLKKPVGQVDSLGYRTSVPEITREAMAYLAGPIDLSENPRDWRTHVSFELNKIGVTTFNPFASFDVAFDASGNPRSCAAVQTINNHAIDYCNVFIGHLPKDVCSVGTPLEIEYALTKPVLTVGHDPDGRLWRRLVIIVAEKLPVSLYRYKDRLTVVKTFHEAVELVKDYVSGGKK